MSDNEILVNLIDAIDLLIELMEDDAEGNYLHLFERIEDLKNDLQILLDE